MRATVLAACILAIATGTTRAAGVEITGQSRAAAKHMPVEVLFDASGEPLRTFDSKLTSSNWSGYVLPHYLTKKSYMAGQATWTVPTVSYHGVEAASASWIGIGGFCTTKKCKEVDFTLIQLGTEQDALSDSETDYYAWYEVLPEAETRTPLAVNPGDVITASLSCEGDCTDNQWDLAMTDETTTQTWSQVVSYESSGLSLEVIQEAPSGVDGILPLADFDTITFSGTTANSAGVNLSKGDSLVMEDRQSSHEYQSSNVSGLDSTHDGFRACFNAHKKLISCRKP
jgi:hypothetical protein